MSEGRGIEGRDRVFCRFTRELRKQVAPEDWLRIGEISRNQGVLFCGGSCKVNDGREVLKPPTDLFARVNHAACGVQYNAVFTRRLDFVQGLAHGTNFTRKVFLFMVAVFGLVRPAHPCRDAADAAVAAGAQLRSELLLDTIVNADRAKSGRGKFSSPMGLARSGHPDE